MEPKAEGSFLKQLQNKLKNLRRKLEKIEAKEKRPITELSEDEKELLKNKPVTLQMFQEYERIYNNYISSKEVPAPGSSAPIETRVEIRKIDSTPEVLSVWFSLHHIAQPGVKEAYLAQGLSLDDFDTAIEVRKDLLGLPGMEIAHILEKASDVFDKFRNPETDEERKRKDILTRVRDWCLTQHVLETSKPLSVDTPREQHQIVAVIPDPAPVVVAPPAEPEPVAEPAKTEEVKEEEAQPQGKEEGTRWADEGEEEEPAKDEPEEPKKEGDDDGFTEVKGKPKRKPQVQSEPRRGDSAHRRPWRGDRRPRGGRRGFVPPPQ